MSEFVVHRLDRMLAEHPELRSYVIDEDSVLAQLLAKPERHDSVTALALRQAGVFVGWVLAWEFPSGVKLGYFHQSQWFDRKGEIKFNCLCASGTFDWTRRFRRGR